MNAIVFCGYHHTGKTTLLERAIPPLSRRGRRVGVVKHASGRLDFGAGGKDLSRYMSAGAVEVHMLALSHGGSRETGGAPDPAAGLLESHLERILAETSADIVLIEGFKEYRGPVPRIVFGKNVEEIEGLVDENTVGYSGFGLNPPRPGEARREACPDERRVAGRRPDPCFLPMDIEPEDLADFLESISRRWTTGPRPRTFRS
jgi:molybdopterin-guanine dinucleotide biosynthesis protein MobB